MAPSGRYERETAPDATLRQLGADTLGLGIDSAGAKRAAAPEARAAPRGAEPPAKKPRQPERPVAAVPRAPPSQAPARRGRPIIMVPPGLTSMVSMYNVGPLLEKGIFKTVEQCRVRR